MNYAQAISDGFPGVVFSAPGDGSIYSEIEWISGTPPTQEELDNFISTAIKDNIWEKIKEERDRRKLDSGYKVGEFWFHSDNTSRIQQIALVILGANMPSGLLWKTMAGTFVPMTPTLAGQIFATAAASDTTLFGVAEVKKQEVYASEDPESIDIMTGWPLGDGE